MSSILSKNLAGNSGVIGPERWEIAVFNLVSTIDTTFLSQSGPKLHKVFIGTRSWMRCEICLVTQKLFTLELLKIAILNIVSLIET